MHNQLKPDDLPQDIVAAFLQRLFPSPVHDSLAANNLQHDDIRKLLTPQSIANLMVLLKDKASFSSQAEEIRKLGFLKAVSTGFQQKLRALQKQRQNPDELKLMQNFKSHKVFRFVELLDAAVTTSLDTEHPNNQFYGPDIVERALLTYMCLQVPGKLGLKTYYDTLAKLEVIDGVDEDSLKSRMSLEDYESLKRGEEEGTIPFDEFLSNPELVLQLCYGYDLFEDTLPPQADYITATYIDPEGEKRKFSNCGEETLLSFLAAIMFNPNLHAFDAERMAALTTKGCTLYAEFASFLDRTLTSPAAVKGTVTQNKFVQLMSNMNTSEIKDEIRYRKIAGKVQKKQHGVKPNGIYEMDAGLDNFLRVVGVLVGDPEWKVMQGTKEAICEAVADNLKRLCSLFSSKGFSLDWKIKGTDEKTIQDETTIDLTFSYNDTEWFHLSFGPDHFDFDRASQKGAEDENQLVKRVFDAEMPWRPHFALLIPNLKYILEHPFSSQEMFESYFKGYLFASDLNTIKSRTKALSGILRYKKMIGSPVYDFLFERWVEPNSEYFDEWNDGHTNLKVLNILAGHMSIEEIRALGIEPLNEYLSSENWRSTYAKICDSERRHIARFILEQEGAIEALAQGNIDVYWSSSSDDSDSDLSDSESWDEDEGEQYVAGDRGREQQPESEPDETMPLLHSLVLFDLPQFMERALELEGSLEALDSSGSTALQKAVANRSTASVSKLLELGANDRVTASGGESLVDCALNNLDADTARIFLERGHKPTSQLAFSAHNSQDPRETIRLLEEFKIPFSVYCKLLTNVAVTEDDFRAFVDRYLDDYQAKFVEMVPSLVETGQVSKLRILSEKGVPFEKFMPLTFSDSLSSKKKKEVGVLLIRNNVSLENLAPLCSSLDIDDFREVVNAVSPEKRDLFKLELQIKTRDDIIKANVLKAQGIQFSRLSFVPSSSIGIDDRIYICEALTAFDCERDHTHLLNASTQVFSGFIEKSSAKAKEGLEQIIPDLAARGQVEKLKILRENGILPPQENFRTGVQCSPEAQIEVCQELLEMGQNYALLNAFLGLVDFKSLVSVLRVALGKGVELHPDINIHSVSGIKILRKLKVLGVTPGHISISIYNGTMNVDNWKDVVRQGYILDEAAVKNMSPEVFSEVVAEYPAERQTELVQLIPHLASNGNSVKLRVLREAGVKPEATNSYLGINSSVPKEDLAEACIELLKMEGDLSYFSYLLSNLNGTECKRVLESVTSGRLTGFSDIWQVTIKTTDDLEQIHARRRAGIEMTPVSFSPDEYLSMEETASLYLDCIDQDISISSSWFVALSKNRFAAFVQSIPPERRQELACHISYLAAHGELNKLRVLREAGIQPIAVASFWVPDDNVSMKKRADACLELLTMGGDLSYFSYLLGYLDGSEYTRVLAEVPEGKKGELTLSHLSIRKKDDLAKVKARHQAGVAVKDVSFSPDSKLSGEETGRLYFECIEFGVDLSDSDLSSVSDEAFEYIISNYPPEKKNDLSQYVFGAAKSGNAKGLQKLREAGVPVPEDVEFSVYRIPTNRFEVVSELARMGASIKQVLDVLVALEKTELSACLKSFKEQPEVEVSAYVESLAEMENYKILVQAGLIKIESFYVSSNSEMNMDEKVDTLLVAVECGQTLSNFQHCIQSILDINAIKKLLQRYPKNRIDEVQKASFWIFTPMGVEQVVPMVEAGVSFDNISFSDEIEWDQVSLEAVCLQLVKHNVDIGQLYHKLIHILDPKTAYKFLSEVSSEQKSQLDAVLFGVEREKAGGIEKVALLVAAGVNPDYKECEWFQTFKETVGPDVWSQIEAKVQELQILEKAG